jgi:FdhE protein
MVKVGAPRHEPIPIGDVATPVFALLPDSLALFARRAERFHHLADSHPLKPYLLFLAGLAEVQHAIAAGLPEPELPEPHVIARAREFGMPPLDRSRFLADPVFDATLERLLSRVHGIVMPKEAAAALTRVEEASEAERVDMARSVLADAIPFESVAEHGFVATALQVHYARLASRLDAQALVPVGDGACPACGGAPGVSMVVGWVGAHGARYCGCGLCATLWNFVRIKCTLCGSTKGISYQEVDGAGGLVKAEACESCHGYVKILQQQRDPKVDILADDVASLSLDLLMRGKEYRRGGVNPFLIGY